MFAKFADQFSKAYDDVVGQMYTVSRKVEVVQNEAGKGLATQRREGWSKRFWLMMIDVRTLAHTTPKDISALRTMTDAAGVPAGAILSSAVRQQAVIAGGVRCIYVWPAAYDTPSACPRKLLYIHGGAFCLGSPETHRQLASQLAQKGDCAVLLPAFRRCPEHTVLQGAEDVMAVYRWLLTSGVPEAAAVAAAAPSSSSSAAPASAPASNAAAASAPLLAAAAAAAPAGSPGAGGSPAAPDGVIVGGESSGANMALALSLKLRSGSAGLPQPAGLLLMSPWVDLVDAIERTNSSWAENEGNDFVLASLADFFARNVLGATHFDGIASPSMDASKKQVADLDVDTLRRIGDAEEISPGRARSLEDLPPTLVTIGSCETLRDSQKNLVEKLRRDGNRVDCQIFADMPHAFPLVHFAASSTCTAPQDVINQAGEFVRKRCEAAAGEGAGVFGSAAGNELASETAATGTNQAAA